MGLGLGMTRTTEIGEDGQIIISSPADVPEVAAGYWWHPSMAVGIGGAGFAVPEGNGHATFALVQAVAANQPTLLTENGQTQFRMRKTGDAVGASSHATAGAVQAGWTGATYIAGWCRLPDAAGAITGSDTLFTHSLTTGNQRRVALSFASGTPSLIQSNPSSDGLSQAGTKLVRATTPTNGSWQYLECAYDLLLTLGGASPADVVKLFSNFAALTLSTAPSVAIGSLFNALAPIGVGCFPATGNVDTLDWAGCYYANGIPSLGNRIALSRWRAPV